MMYRSAQESQPHLNRPSISSNHQINLFHHHHHHQPHPPPPSQHFQIPIYQQQQQQHQQQQHHQQQQQQQHQQQQHHQQQQQQQQQQHFHSFQPSQQPLYQSNLHLHQQQVQVPSHNFHLNRSHHSNSLHPNHHHHHHPFLINSPSIPLQSPLPPTFSAYLQQHKHQQLLLSSSSSSSSSPLLKHQPRSPTSSNHSNQLHLHNHQTPFNQYSKPESKTPIHQSNLTFSTLHTPQLITPTRIISNGTRKKLKIRLPLEFTPNHQLSLDESRIRSKWKRQPISIKLDILNSLNQFNDDLFESTSKDEWPQRLGNRLPDSIDVYLPGKEVWDDYRAEILDEKLNELGYHSIQKDENLIHLDLRLRLEAYLSDHPESTFQIPTIPGVYPFALPPSPISPISKPLMSFTAPILAPRGHSSTMSIALPGGTPNQYLASNRSSTFGPPSTPGEPIGPGLQPTAPIFKPTGTLLPTAPEFQPTWAPAPAPVPISIRPRGSISPHRILLSPTLMIVGEEEDEEEAEAEEELKRQLEEGEIVTDSEPEPNQQEVLTDSEAEDDQEEGEIGESMMRNEIAEDYYSGPDSVEEEVMNEHNHLMRSSISSQALGRISFKPIISDSRPVIKSRSSGEEEDDIPLAKLKDQRFSNQVHHLDHSSQTSSLPTGKQITQDQRSEYTNPSDEDQLRTDRHPSSVSLPSHRTTQSHTFGINSFSVSGRSSMTAGDGVPHNWINGVEDEDDIISNPSDEGQDLIQNEDDQMYRTNLEATRSRIAEEEEEVSKPILNAFAAEFKPNFTFSSMIPQIGSLSKQVEDDEHQLIGSPGRGIKRQKTQQEVWIEEEGGVIPSFSGSSTFHKFISFSTNDQFYQSDEKDKSKSYSLTPTPPTIEEEISFERPGKDNMRTFKFPYTKNPNESSSIEYRTQSISSPLSNSKPNRVENLSPLRQSVSLPPPFSLPELPELLAASTSGIASDSIREDPNYENYKTLPHNLGSIMIPNSPLIQPIMRDQPITPKVTRLRPSSSFDDESSSSVEHHSKSSSPSPSRLSNQPRSFELIPTQNISSKDSMISLNQLKQQKIEWNQIDNQGNLNSNVKIGSEEIVKISSSASKKRGEIPKFLDHDLDSSSLVGQAKRIEKLSIGPKIVVGEKSGGIEEIRFLDMTGVNAIRISNRVALDEDEDAEGEEDEDEEDEEMQSESSEKDEVEEGDVSTTNYINKLLNKKFKELRQDLSGLHSLKVDFDSLKRDALLEEMHKRMEMVIEESQRKSKGNETERILRAIKDEKKTEEEIELMMIKLSEAVKPQIYQLIDLTSDKSETAGLIVQELKPSLEDLIKKSLLEFKVEKEKERMDEEGNTESLKVGEEMIELMTQLDIKSLNFYQDISQQIGNTINEISELIKSEIKKEVIESQTNEIQQLKNIKNELESGLLKARSDHGRVRSERAVEKEKMMEEKSKVEKELEDLKKKKKSDELEIERFKKVEKESDERRKLEMIQKEKVERERDELKELVKRLENRCEGFEVKEKEWESKRILQTEEIVELKIKNRMIESTNQSNERRLESIQDGYERLQEVRNLDLIRFQTKEDEIRNQIRNQENEFNLKNKENEKEIREAIEGKALVEGEVRSLEGRINKLDEQISGLREMSAAKQQSLAIVNQRLYESERKLKEVESLRNEMNKLKSENLKLKMNEEQLKLIKEEKNRIEIENEELIKEIDHIKMKLEKMYKTIENELKEVYEKYNKLKEENQLIKIEKEKLEKEKLEKEKLEKEKLEKEKLEKEKLEKEKAEKDKAEKEKVEKEKLEKEKLEKEKLEKEKLDKEKLEKEKLEKENLIRFEGNSKNSTYNQNITPKKFYPTPPLESYDFIKSNVPLSNSIHAPKSQQTQSELRLRERERYDEDELDSNEGTVKSFGIGGGNMNRRSISPAFSRTSSRAIMDQDGWWSVE